MTSDLTPIELHIQLNYSAIDVHVVNASANQQIVKFGCSPSGTDWHAVFYSYFREEHQMVVGRTSIETVLIEIGMAGPHEEIPRTRVVQGRNLDTGLPDRVEMSSTTITETAEWLVSELHRGIVWHLKRTLASVLSQDTTDLTFIKDLDVILSAFGLVLQSITLEAGDFPPIKGLDYWLHELFGVSVQYE